MRGLDCRSLVMATAAVAATAFNGLDGDVLPIIGVSLLIGLAVGLTNGLLITKRSVPPFLATLAMWIVLEGCRNAYNGRRAIGKRAGAFPRDRRWRLSSHPEHPDHGSDCASLSSFSMYRHSVAACSWSVVIR